jgi:hypothetical protein
MCSNRIVDCLFVVRCQTGSGPICISTDGFTPERRAVGLQTAAGEPMRKRIVF